MSPTINHIKVRYLVNIKVVKAFWDLTIVLYSLLFSGPLLRSVLPVC